MHINGTYIRRGDLDIHELFAPVDITDKVRAKLPGVNDNIRRIQAALSEKAEPNIDFSLSCQKCVFWQYCSRNLPKPNVFDLPGTGSAFSYKHKLAIYKDGDIAFNQLRGRSELRERQILSVEGVLDGKTILRKDKIRAFLRTLTYPMYFLDYEGINPPIPPYDGTRPHHQTPFQYSLHWIEREGGELHHAEFLGNPEVSPLRDLAEQLCRDIPKDVCVIVYNDTYDCLKYVWTVCEGENRLNTADRPDQIMVGDYDSKRHNAHENAISSVAVMNRLAGQYAITAAFTGDLKDRHQVADFCLELVNWLFQNRRKVL